MSKCLYLLRHAQTLERRKDEADFDRQLTSIGSQNATRMGRNLKNKEILPDIILSSPAVRAQATAEQVSEQIAYDPFKIHFNHEIYDASVRTLLEVVNNMKREWQTVLIIGHNPSINYLAEYITGEAIGNMSTCGLVCIEFDEDDWSLLSEGTGNFKWYEYPALLNF